VRLTLLSVREILKLSSTSSSSSASFTSSQGDSAINDQSRRERDLTPIFVVVERCEDDKGCEGDKGCEDDKECEDDK
jgi:hypothetical protein